MKSPSFLSLRTVTCVLALTALTAGHAAEVVLNTNDSGVGSLRQALADAATLPGPDTITFAPALSGQTIALSTFSESGVGNSALVVNDSGGVTLDASSLPGGLTISDGSTTNFRLFLVPNGSALALDGLTLKDGGGAGFPDYGGAIHNDGALTLTRCTLTENSACSGGAIATAGTAMLTHCTLSGNTATGASPGLGGAISSLGTLVLTHCTLSGNTASNGGGVYVQNGDLALTNTLIAGNTTTSGAGDGPDILNFGIIVRQGVNIVQFLANFNPVTGPGTILAVAAPLAPLGNYGGPTQTMALLSGSPALDAASILDPAPDTDQRGFPRNRDGDGNNVALPDIGAYEAQVEPFSVGFNFVGGGPAGSAGTLVSTEVAGAFPQANWNNLTTDYDGTGNGTYTNGPASIKDGSGASFSPNLKLWWDAPNTYGQSALDIITSDQKLMGGYLASDGSGNGSAATNLYSGTSAQPFFAVAGLPAAATLGGYKVIVYAGAGGHISRYWLTSNRGQNPASVGSESALTDSIFTLDNSSGTYTRATATSDTGATTPGGNYVQFDGLTEPGGFIVRAEEGSLPVGNQGRAPINAVQIIRNEILVVTTTQDENDPSGTPGTGLSLREALRDAPDGAGIVFDPSLNGATITPGSELIFGKNLVVDASSLPAGITLSGNHTSALVKVELYYTVSMLNMKFTEGGGVYDGAIFVDEGTLTLTRCTLTGNTATRAVYNDGLLTLSHCTLSGNSITSSANWNGAAIYNEFGSELRLNDCTMSENHAANEGGAIYNKAGANATLTRCTLTANTAEDHGGAVLNNGTLTVTHSTISGNTGGATGGGGIRNVGFVSVNFSIVAGNTGGDLDGTGTTTGTGNITTGNPLLAPLGNYGGPTQTMALLPGSPARDTATGSTAISDQRGFPIFGVPDIGAYEAGTYSNYNAFIWESLPVAASEAQHAAGVDYDGDGNTNQDEYSALTDPANAGSFLRVTGIERSGGNLIISFPGVAGRTYRLERSDTLAADSWVNTGLTPFPGDGSVKSFTVPAGSPGLRFFRVVTP